MVMWLVSMSRKRKYKVQDERQALFEALNMYAGNLSKSRCFVNNLDFYVFFLYILYRIEMDGNNDFKNTLVAMVKNLLSANAKKL